MPRDLKVYLEDIAEAIKRIEQYTDGVTLEQISTDTMRLDAVIRNIQLVGEATKEIPDDTREKYPAIKWKNIVGLRNLVVHEYFRVNPEIIWNTIQEHLPNLKAVILELLAVDDEIDET